MSHDFNESYRGIPPWDIGRPQPEFVKLAEKGEIRGSVLDVGCGTGEHATYFRRLGHESWGLDSAPLAIEKARAKALERKVNVEFIIGDALHLEKLKRRFDTVTDCGLFHTFSNDDRTQFAKSLRAVLNESGTYFMLCFSDKEPADWGGPRRIAQREIRETFHGGWRINYIREAKISTTQENIYGYAWLCSISIA